MKPLALYVTVIISIFTLSLSAQSQCKKGHFIFGTDLVQYSAGKTSYNDMQGSKVTDSGKYTFNNLSYGLNAWAGYCVSNRVCVGLTYNFGQSLDQYYSYPYVYGFAYYPGFSLFPSNLFFRYYIIRADSGNFFDLGLEGNFGVQYTSESTTSSPEYNGTNYSETFTEDFLNLNSSINLLASLHVSKHFALQLIGGMQVSYESINFVSASTSPPSPNFDFTPSKSSFTTYMFTGSLRLQFYL